jgi:hypothetical protein
MLGELVGGGVVLRGRYKRAGRPGSDVAIEVTGVADIPSRFGPNAYVIGTRLDAAQAGNVVAMRLDCFNPETMTVKSAHGFKALAVENYLVTPGNASFSFLELVEDAEDRKYGLTNGSKALADLMRAPEAPKAKRERKPKAEAAPEA